MRRVNVYYMGAQGHTFNKIKNFLNIYKPSFFYLKHIKNMTDFHNQNASFRDIVVVNLDIQTHSHLEELKIIKKEVRKVGTTIISVTNTIDHNTVATVAEIGYDGVLIKPFNLKSFQNVIDNIKFFSFETTDYFLEIERGKKALYQEKNYTKSYTIFNRTIRNNPTPTLGYYYLGKTCELMNKDVNAINHYRRGLRLNKWHFKSLVSLLDSYLRHQDSDEAFTLLKHMTKAYPESPERFCLIIKLAIKNFKFHEVPGLCAIYEAINDKNKEIDKYFFAALFVSIKFFLNKSKVTQANNISKTLSRLTNKNRYYNDLIENVYQNFGQSEEFEQLKLSEA